MGRKESNQTNKQTLPLVNRNKFSTVKLSKGLLLLGDEIAMKDDNRNHKVR